MRVVEENQVVLAGSGLALVAVDQHVFGLGGLLGDEGPLHTGRETCASATAKIGGLHLLNDPVGALCEAFPDGFVAAEFDVLVDVGGALTKTLGDDLDFVGMRDKPGHYRPPAFWRYPARMPATLSGVRSSWKS